MPQNDNAAPAGWYPDPQGVNRYWDGASWLSIPDPQTTASDEAAQTNRRRERRRGTALGMSVLVVWGMVAGGAGLWVLALNAERWPAIHEKEAEIVRLQEQIDAYRD